MAATLTLAGIRQNVQRFDRSRRIVVGSAVSFAGTTAITSGTGFVYWWVAARQFSASDVGFAASAISTMMLLGTIAVCGLGTVLSSELPNSSNPRALISTSIIATGLIGFLLGVPFAILAPLLSPDLAELRGSVLEVLVFGFGVGITAQAAVLDQALLGLLRGDLQFWRNAIFAIGKLVLLSAIGVAALTASGLGIYTTWVVATAGSLLALMVFARTFRNLVHFDGSILRTLSGRALSHHMLNVAIMAPALGLPLVVTVLLSAEDCAYFYTTWLMAGFVFVPPFALTMGLFTAGARDVQDLPRLMRFTMLASTGLNLVTVPLVWLGAPIILSIFGSAYADAGVMPLRIACLAAFPLIIKDNYVAKCRVQGSLIGPSLILCVGSACEFIGAGIGAYFGELDGLIIGWVTAVVAQALLLIPFLRQANTAKPAPSSSAPAGEVC